MYLRCLPLANFRLVVFAPIEGEVIVGTVHSSTTDHIRGKPNMHCQSLPALMAPRSRTVSLGFFSDIYIPKHALPPNTFLCVISPVVERLIRSNLRWVSSHSDHEDNAFFMIPDMEEVDVGEPDEAKKDPFNSDKDSMCYQLHCLSPREDSALKPANSSNSSASVSVSQ